ncbi:MAG: DUF3179 domain-containing protein [Planctomycetes bacterium]|nr:DUF3179 domain-containing protein [Planctomycetota bacterium]
MKQGRTQTWAVVSLSAALFLGFLGLVALILVLSGNTGIGQRGESLPQLTDRPGFSPSVARLWGMPNRHLFSPIECPRYVAAAEAEGFLRCEDRVYLIRKTGTIYVFPEVLLTSYHVVNDVIDGEPMAVSYCLLAGSACRFSRRVEDRVLTLGLTGQLFGGNSVLYDKETKTDWLQLNGEPLRGPYYGRARLEARPLERSTWKRVRAEKGLAVLAPLRDMEEYRSFHRDMEAEKLGQKVVESQARLDPRLLPYTGGLGIHVQGETRFYPEDPNARRSLCNDAVGGWAVLVLQGGDEEACRILRRRLDGRVLDFELRDGVLRDRQTGSTWSDEGVCTGGPLAGVKLDAPYYTHVYWFVWASLYPETGLP